VARNHHPAASLDGGRDAMSISKILRASFGRAKDTPDKPSEIAICVTDIETRLPAQARIDDLVLFGPL